MIDCDWYTCTCSTRKIIGYIDHRVGLGLGST